MTKLETNKPEHINYEDGTFTIEISTKPIETSNEQFKNNKCYRWALLYHNCGETFTILVGYSDTVEQAGIVAVHYYKECILHGKED